WQLIDFGYADIGGPSTVLTAVGFGLAGWWALAGDGAEGRAGTGRGGTGTARDDAGNGLGGGGTGLGGGGRGLGRGDRGFGDDGGVREAVVR
ncbi:hypothetical protein IPZ69_45570, partial [Streptomyces olivochromogenes]|nr:hypothetical protein [Streptomyces olivochromogenes]